MRLSVYTPVGKFTSKDFESSEKYHMLQMFKEKLTYVTLDTEFGSVLFKEETLKNSVIVFEGM